MRPTPHVSPALIGDALVVDLRYPESWFAPANRHARAVGARLDAWFREIGVVADPVAAARLRRLDVAGYGGLPFALADREVLETVAAMLALWIFHDDAIEGRGDDDGGTLLTALSGAPALRGRDTPIVRGYRELGGRFLQRMSAPWRQRHLADFAAWLMSVDDEAELARRFRAGQRLTVADHMRVREINVGMIPVIDWIEYDLGDELPMEVHEHPAMEVVVRAACRAVAFTNELYGYSKDREAVWINAVACAERELASTPAAGFARIATLHDEAVAELHDAEGDLLDGASDRALVAAWLGRLHHVISGFAAWHARAPRYRAAHVVDGGRIRLRLGRSSPGRDRLATDRTRATDWTRVAADRTQASGTSAARSAGHLGEAAVSVAVDVGPALAARAAAASRRATSASGSSGAGGSAWQPIGRWIGR